LSAVPPSKDEVASIRAEIARLDAKLERYVEAFDEGNRIPAALRATPSKVRGTRHCANQRTLVAAPLSLN